MNIEMVDIKTIIPYVRNPRKNDEAVDKVAGSIQEFGWKQPIVVDKDNVIVVGHTRYLAAQKLGIEEVPILVADELNPQQIKAYRIADNKTAEFSTWDNEQLVLEIQELQNDSYDVLKTGFEQEEIDNLIEIIEGTEVEDIEDEWDGMPNYNNEDQTSFRHIIVHFDDQEGIDAFARLLGNEYSITDKSKYIHFPPVENKDHKSEIFESDDEQE